MLTPLLIQLLFWLGTGACGYGITVFVKGRLSVGPGSDWTTQDIVLVIAGVTVMLFATVVLRLLCESWILFFRMNETLTEILHENERHHRRQ